MVLGLGGAIIGGKGDGVDQGRASDASASTAAFVVIQGIGPVSTDDRLRCRRVASAAGQGALTGIDVSHTDRARWPSRLPHRPRLRRYPRAVTVIAAASLAPVIVMVLGLGGAIIGGKGDGVDQGRASDECIDGQRFVVIQGIGPVSTDDRHGAVERGAAGQGVLDRYRRQSY